MDYSDGEMDREGYKFILLFSKDIQFEQKAGWVASSPPLSPSTYGQSLTLAWPPPSLDLDIKSTVWDTDVNFCKP